MPKARITFETICEIGLALPDVERSTAWRSPALKVRGHLIAVVPTHKSAEANSVAVCIPFEQRDELLAAEPNVYYIKDHYEAYPVVLVRLSRVHLDALRDLLRMAWEHARRKSPRRPGGERAHRRQGR